jgi:hypothetical protein
LHHCLHHYYATAYNTTTPLPTTYLEPASRAVLPHAGRVGDLRRIDVKCLLDILAGGMVVAAIVVAAMVVAAMVVAVVVSVCY